MIPQAATGKLFVKISSRHIDEIKTGSGIKFFVDTTYRPEWHVNLEGVVVSTPMTVGLQLENRGIQPDVKVGDTIVFEWSVCHDPENELSLGDESYWMVEYFQVTAIKRDNVLIPVGGKVLIEPYIEQHAERTAGGIILPESSRETVHKDMGYVRFIGKPKKNQWMPKAEPGDLVMFHDWAAAKAEIDGKNYYIVDQDFIYASVEHEI